MQFLTILSVLATAVVAQDLSGVPVCARQCFLDSFPISGCADRTDFACICRSTDYNDAVTLCVLTSCSDAEDVAKTLAWAQKTCADAGVPI
ncbi:CFEM domain-containing protein [Paramyrothecium foliicola]|nr:CFEM domain-containing protein [Paramyrothecium foliicola]